MKVESIAFSVVIIFAVFGALMMGIILHEMSHRNDFEELSTGDSYICFFSVPEDFQLHHLWSYIPAYYHLEADAEDTAEVMKVNSYTEYKATGITILIYLLFIICFGIVLFKRWKNERKIKYLQREHDSRKSMQTASVS